MSEKLSERLLKWKRYSRKVPAAAPKVVSKERYFRLGCKKKLHTSEDIMTELIKVIKKTFRFPFSMPIVWVIILLLTLMLLVFFIFCIVTKAI